jgi:SAM-dependent methyltransferase/uncharacterized protein YbaR (Trm112 family)
METKPIAGLPIMKTELLKLLCCPSCSGELLLLKVREGKDEVKSGTLGCVSCGAEFAVENYVPCFVPAVNYSANFGFQWNRFSKTQLDSHSGHPISRARFFQESGWTPDELRGAIVLDAGCGSGRFAEIALDCGATVVAVDYSAAVAACWDNLQYRGQFHVVQADICHLPFRKSCFDYVYSFGVLQHTPDPRLAFDALPQCLKSGGSIAVDIYRLSWKCLVMPKYWLRPVTKRLPAKLLFRLVNGSVPILLPLSRLIARLPKIGGRFRYLIPVANYEGTLPLSQEQQFEWAVLDTFDMLSPAYDKPKMARTLRRWFKEVGLQDVQISESYVAVGKGRKPRDLPGDFVSGCIKSA